MSLHINKDRDNIDEEFIEHDDSEELVPEWFAPTSSSVSSTPYSNLIWYNFK